ncbi:MAG: hypothetical protein J3R72DRAFT_253774 [Linnemannia gamsii]|nr:MAG: hypothetical protein J3R72DRAFT_253774 [Linnemannia gamsii]
MDAMRHAIERRRKKERTKDICMNHNTKEDRQTTFMPMPTHPQSTARHSAAANNHASNGHHHFHHSSSSHSNNNSNNSAQYEDELPASSKAPLKYALKDIHPDDSKDKVFAAILKALLYLRNKPSSPKELANCIMKNKYTMLG